MQADIERMQSDMESEKGTRKRRNEGFDREDKELQDQINELKEWKSNIQGRMAIAVFVWGVLQALIIWLITKNK